MRGHYNLKTYCLKTKFTHPTFLQFMAFIYIHIYIYIEIWLYIGVLGLQVPSPNDLPSPTPSGLESLFDSMANFAHLGRGRYVTTLAAPVSQEGWERIRSPVNIYTSILHGYLKIYISFIIHSCLGPRHHFDLPELATKSFHLPCKKGLYRLEKF